MSALLPHQIISSLEKEDIGGKVAELQWKRMVDDMLEYGKMRNCLTVCDISEACAEYPWTCRWLWRFWCVN